MFELTRKITLVPAGNPDAVRVIDDPDNARPTVSAAASGGGAARSTGSGSSSTSPSHSPSPGEGGVAQDARSTDKKIAALMEEISLEEARVLLEALPEQAAKSVLEALPPERLAQIVGQKKPPKPEATTATSAKSKETL